MLSQINVNIQLFATQALSQTHRKQFFWVCDKAWVENSLILNYQSEYG